MKKYVYSEANQVVVCGDFARAGRSHNRWGGAVSPRRHILESCYLHLEY